MSALTKIIQRNAAGNTRFGSHFIMDFWRCPTRWFNRYIRPHPTKAGVGCVPAKLSKPLHIGSLFHIGMENYYLSGWKDGKYDIDKAIQAAEQAHLERRKDMESADEADASWIQTKRLLQRYAEHWGPGGSHCEYPELSIASDANGLPLLEREFEIDLDFNDYVFTCKPDAIIWYGGALAVLEHKTTAASRLSRVFDEMNMSIQTTGEWFVLKSLFPDEPIHSIVISAAVKDRSAKALKEGSLEFERRSFARSATDLYKFKRDVIDTLVEMDQCVEVYNEELSAGKTVDEAARRAFAMHRTSCVDGFYKCDYYAPCSALGRESQMFLSGYKPRSVERQYEEPANEDS